MTAQLDWVSGLAVPIPRAHRADPRSSHEAAAQAVNFTVSHCEIVLQGLRKWPLSTSAELAQCLGFGLYQVRRRLTDLLEAGRVRRIDPTDDTAPCAMSHKRVCRWEVA